MTESSFPFHIASWPMENLDFHMGPSDELGPYPFIASDFPLTTDEGLDPFWTAEQLNWVNTYPTKAAATQPYPQSWYDFGLPINPLAKRRNPPIRGHTDFKLASQRALFMTPSPNALPFPGSPISDPYASPEPSHASSIGWPGEERDDAQYTPFHSEPSKTNIQPQARNNGINSPHRECSTTNEECFTPLEMPDGSTRLTTNWLPVDCDAGFTIGSPIAHEQDVAAFRSAMMIDQNSTLKDMQHAFFPSDPAAWSYDR
ncbi:hypothetical protein N7457_002629 [Penicillium paradoxum]|uniref:uncharacterized protein n=1 Tax=Penicillium paradoxum TaxID=176176 RepID=UPI002547ACB0|nr:uncharacterized protein N7457_002629 [Penicillium paradoxum]KAJ5787639.1 hypothetical protein N7457_002629 [Penicillium paradoxum]